MSFYLGIANYGFGDNKTRIMKLVDSDGVRNVNMQVNEWYVEK